MTPFAEQIAAMSSQSLRNVEYGLLLRINGCDRRGQVAQSLAAQEKFKAVKAELRRRDPRREEVA